MKTNIRSVACLITVLVFSFPQAFTATVDISGVYAGSIEIAGVRTDLALVLLQRNPRGSILAAALGGGEGLSIDNARIDAADQVTFDVIVADKRIGWSGAVATMGRLVGTTTDGTRSEFRPLAGRIDDRQLFFAVQPAVGDPTDPTSFAVATDSAGRLVGGTFLADETCGLFGCQGAITRFSEVDDSVDVMVRIGGACSGRGRLQATFDSATLFYAGTASVNDCTGRRTVQVLGVRAQRSNSDDAQSILEALASLADGLESSVPFGATHTSLASDYLDTGRDQAALLDGYNLEKTRYTGIHADFTRLRGLYTIVDPTAFPDILAEHSLGILFDERRTGVPVGDTERVLIVDGVRRPGLFLLDGWTVESGLWVIRGDQSPALDLPFDYTLGADTIRIPTPGGTIFASHGAFGAHFGPHTGDPAGEAKANFVGFFTENDTDMVELVGDMDGVRDPGELWGYDGGTAGERIRDRRPVYTSPLPATLTRVRFNEGPTVYFDNEPHWEFELDFGNDVRMSFGHVGRFTPALRDRILLETGINTDTYAGPVGEILANGNLALSAGEPVAFPQVLAEPLPPPFGLYYVGGGSFLSGPWAQMEFPVIGPVGADRVGAQVCVYEMLLPSVAAVLQTALDNQMADATSQRFGPFANERWRWAAEGRLCSAFSSLPEDFEELGTRFGGWYERAAPGTVRDELVAFVHIAKDAASYDPLLYDSTDVDYLITRLRANQIPYSWTLPDGSIRSVFGPTGEILSLDDSVFLVKWRDIPGFGAPPIYQWASYLLNAEGLKIAWGDLLSDPAGGVAPPLSDAVACNDTTVLCYSHDGNVPGL